jgi:predicted enzyme related to lactoylglutathione lyase
VSERDGYQHGVPCWVDTWQPDADAAVAFYTQLFGWEAEETTPPGSDRRMFMCRLRGRDVTAIGSPTPVPDHTPVWGTYIWVDSVDDTAAKATEAGGKVAVLRLESLDRGRIAVLVDPAGAVFGIWEPGEHRGAQLVNEPGAWSMSVVNTRDPEASTEFYGALFGWEPEAMDGGNGGISMMRLPGFEGGEPEQREQGGAVIAPPYDVPGVGLRQAVLADPQGAAFSITRAPGPPRS